MHLFNLVCCAAGRARTRTRARDRSSDVALVVQVVD